MKPFLNILLGPMFSGKSTELIRRIRKYKTINKKIIVVTHINDSLRTNKNIIETHDNVFEEAVSLHSLRDIEKLPEFEESEMIFIEEGQFFEDIYDTTIWLVEKKEKCVTIAGLDGTSERKGFGKNIDLLRLLPIAEDFIKFRGLCKFCNDGTESSFTLRLTESKEEVLVGGEESYVGVCRKHWKELGKK
jgi:thymidine kinase